MLKADIDPWELQILKLICLKTTNRDLIFPVPLRQRLVFGISGAWFDAAESFYFPDGYQIHKLSVGFKVEKVIETNPGIWMKLGTNYYKHIVKTHMKHWKHIFIIQDS